MKVECIKDDWTPRPPMMRLPMVGRVYTVIGRDRDRTNREGYLLSEIDSGMWRFGVENFRPITDISIFQRLTKVRELEDA